MVALVAGKVVTYTLNSKWSYCQDWSKDDPVEVLTGPDGRFKINYLVLGMLWEGETVDYRLEFAFESEFSKDSHGSPYHGCSHNQKIANRASTHKTG